MGRGRVERGTHRFIMDAECMEDCTVDSFKFAALLGLAICDLGEDDDNVSGTWTFERYVCLRSLTRLCYGLVAASLHHTVQSSRSCSLFCVAETSSPNSWSSSSSSPSSSSLR